MSVALVEAALKAVDKEVGKVVETEQKSYWLNGTTRREEIAKAMATVDALRASLKAL